MCVGRYLRGERRRPGTVSDRLSPDDLTSGDVGPQLPHLRPDGLDLPLILDALDGLCARREARPLLLGRVITENESNMNFKRWNLLPAE